MLLNNLILVNTELCETADEKYNTYFSISEVMSSTAICSNPSRDPVFWLGVHQINDQWVNIYTNQITTLPWAYGYPIRMTDTVLIDGGWHNSRVFVLENLLKLIHCVCHQFDLFFDHFHIFDLLCSSTHRLYFHLNITLTFWPNFTSTKTVLRPVYSCTSTKCPSKEFEVRESK